MPFPRLSFDAWTALQHLVEHGETLPHLVDAGAYVELADVGYIDRVGSHRVVTSVGVGAWRKAVRLDRDGRAPWKDGDSVE